MAVYRPSDGTWHWIQSSTSQAVNPSAFGIAGDIPVPGDFDGDGKTDMAVYRPSDGTWHWLSTSTGQAVNPSAFGIAGDVPVPGDFE
jgi:hypothetical protein